MTVECSADNVRLQDLTPFTTRFVLGWGVLVKGRVSALPMIEHLDVFEDVLRRFVARGVVPMIDQLTVECPKETFDAGVVPAGACAAHAGDEAVPIEDALVAGGGAADRGAVGTVGSGRTCGAAGGGGQGDLD